MPTKKIRTLVEMTAKGVAEVRFQLEERNLLHSKYFITSNYLAVDLVEVLIYDVNYVRR